jgi:hypothetical protein
LEPAYRCSEGHRIGNRHDRRQRRSVRDTDEQEDPKPGRKTIAECDDSGRGEQYGKGLPVLAEPICEARNDRTGDQSDGGSRGQHRADLRRPEPAFMKERGQKRGRDAERREHRAIENQKAIE